MQYNIGKGGVHLKRIIFCLLLILGVSNIAFAEEYVTYKNNYFQAAFLKSWETLDSDFSMRTTSPDGSCSILICSYPRRHHSLDERIALFEESASYNKILEEKGTLLIDNIPAKYSLFSDKNAENIKDKYYLYYYLYTDDSFYIFWDHGQYKNLDQDRKIISTIISNIEIYK